MYIHQGRFTQRSAAGIYKPPTMELQTEHLDPPFGIRNPGKVAPDHPAELLVVILREWKQACKLQTIPAPIEMNMLVHIIM
jgi:hypothetical protein